MIGDILKELEEIGKRGKDVVIIGDFNCKKVNWEEGTSLGGEDS